MKESKYTPEDVMRAICECANCPLFADFDCMVLSRLGERLFSSLNDEIVREDGAYTFRGAICPNYNEDPSIYSAAFPAAVYRGWFDAFNQGKLCPLPVPDVLKTKEESRYPWAASAPVSAATDEYCPWEACEPIEAAPAPISADTSSLPVSPETASAPVPVETVRPDYWPEGVSPADVMEAFNPNGPRYSVELALALYAWSRYGVLPVEAYPVNRKTPRARMEWILENEPATKAAFSAQAEETQKKIKAVANWNKTGKIEIDHS